MVDWDQVVARNVRRLRQERGMTQEQLALEADVAVRSIGHIERQEFSATVPMLGKIARALGVHPRVFWEDLQASSVPRS